MRVCMMSPLLSSSREAGARPRDWNTDSSPRHGRSRSHSLLPPYGRAQAANNKGRKAARSLMKFLGFQSQCRM